MEHLKTKERLLLFIDGTNLMHRHFYVNPELTSKEGIPTGALYGTIKALYRYATEFTPYNIYVCLDKHRKTFRNDIFPEYKANRGPTNEILKSQFPLLKEFCSLAKIPCLEVDNYEADDLLGSLSFHAKQYGFHPCIISGDKDMFQLIEKDIDILYLSHKGPILFQEKELKEKYQGLEKEQFIDFKALMGDKGDNVPGIPSVGEKTAIKLLKNYHTIEGIYENIEDIKGKLKENILASKEEVERAKKLVTIHCEVPLDYNSLFELDAESSYDFSSKEVVNFLNTLDIKKI